MAYFADEAAVRADMNDVRRRLAKQNPHGYTCPMQIQFTPDFCIREDVLPLFYCSSVVREQLEKIPERPSTAILCVQGSTDVDAFRIVLAYAHGSSHAHNWVADLGEQPELAAYVWELAVVYKIEKLEKFTREPAFDAQAGSLNIETAVRLLKNAEHIPVYRDKALKYLCYHFAEIVAPPESSMDSYFGIGAGGSENGYLQKQQETCRDFGYLTYKEMKEILTSVHMRATEEQRFTAINRWAIFEPPASDPCVKDDKPKKDECQGAVDPCKDVDPCEEVDPCKAIEPVKKTESERARAARSSYFYRLSALIYYPLISNKNSIIMEFEDYNADIIYGLPPRKADDRRRIGSMRFYAFKLDDLIEKIRSKEEFYEPPRLKGLFKAYNYYWQLEVPWYLKAKGPSMGVLLRVLHGTDEAGSKIKGGELAGLMTKFLFRLHCSNDFNKCYRQSDVLHVDMLNLPGGSTSYGIKNFLDKNSCRFVRKQMKKGCLYVSVQICNVKELPKKM
jgi:hypothetical protein